jgi:hypothetical protein
MVIALIALFVAMGGSAVAVTRVPPNSVGTAQLQNSAVTNSKLATGSVSGRTLQSQSVSNSAIATNAITQRTMAGNSIGTAEIQQNSITQGDLRVGSVTTGTIANGGVTTGKLATGAVTSTKIRAGNVGARALRGLIVRSASTTIASGSGGRVITGVATVRCRSGEQAVGAGTIWTGGVNDDLGTVFTQLITGANNVPVGATARGFNSSGTSHRFTVQVACLLP